MKMASILTRYGFLLLLSLSLGLRAVVPAGFMPGQSDWIDFCPHQGWDSGFLERVQAGGDHESDHHAHHSHHSHHAHHEGGDAEGNPPHCPWSPLGSAVPGPCPPAEQPLPLASRLQPAAASQWLGRVSGFLPPVRAPPLNRIA
ncbi:hypothetical protein VCB98_09020 [Gammaproteobacteria bacterium AB-CW1]|uniref:Uncharacterized protein n=1 Tax=Natronospira elongata TaxID=3110268 RepID=A0AAP6JIR4_9GAMM|nr:hypothetical protein [Gammaproteobacteria bacterium AB-CW1]